MALHSKQKVFLENVGGDFSSFQLSRLEEGAANILRQTKMAENIPQKHSQITQAIGEWFESWQNWQKRVVLSGIIHRFGKPQLKSLNMAVESVFHRDFLNNEADKYPMKKVRSSIKTTEGVQWKDTETNNLEITKHTPVNQTGSTADDMPSKSPNYAVFSTRSPVSSPITNSSNSSAKYRRSLKPSNNSSRQKNRTKSVGEESDLVARPDSKASIWMMGPPETNYDDASSEFQSRISAINVITDDFFSESTNNDILGKFVTTQSKAGSQFISRLDKKRNHLPVPTSQQLYKNEKLWSNQHITLHPKLQRLKELFQNQMNQIWEWINPWEGYQRVRLLLFLISQSESAIVKFVADCVKQKLAEVTLAESGAPSLPDVYWIKVFNYLGAKELVTAGEVCKRWHNLTQNDKIWKTKCAQIGKEFGIPNLVNLMEENAEENETLDWIQAYIELVQRTRENADKLTALIKTKPDDISEAESESESDDDDEVQEKYKDYVPFWKIELNQPPKKNKFPRQQKARLLTPKRKKAKPPPDLTSTPGPKGPVESTEEAWASTYARSEVQSDSLKEPQAQATGGFLQMWKNITEELKDTDAESDAQRSDKYYEVEMLDDLLADEEVDAVNEEGELFAVDHRPKAPKTATGKFWLVDSHVVPVTKVICLEGHKGPVNCIVCQGKRIFSGGLDRIIRIWTSSGESFAKLGGSLKGSVVGMAIGADEKCQKLYAASWDESVSVFDCLTRKSEKQLTGHKDTVSDLSVDAKYIVTCSHDGTIRVWNIITHHCERVLKCHKGAVHCLTYANKLIITGGADKLIHISCADTGDLLKTLRGHKSPVNAVERQHSLVVSGDLEGMVKFWSLDGDGSPMESVKAHPKQINAIAFRGGRFFTASKSRPVDKRMGTDDDDMRSYTTRSYAGGYRSSVHEQVPGYK
ncbi:uncharacterized protein LOC143445945 isoform X2 [Clavelina lepadiformis]|uniref:uncharacterized protein LOC143445945 isoform X2 n=1 Tax=Clavelina lepadiformis TaxID=159417 RepID=UPI004042B4FD